MSETETSEHPEKREGEVLLTNVFTKGDFAVVGWESKRMGEKAYDSNGDPVPGANPVFVQRSELEEAGFDPDQVAV